MYSDKQSVLGVEMNQGNLKFLNSDKLNKWETELQKYTAPENSDHKVKEAAKKAHGMLGKCRNGELKLRVLKTALFEFRRDHAPTFPL